MNFKCQFGEKVVFCKRCGQLAGTPKKCLANPGGGYFHHVFITAPAGIYVCTRCGATIGQNIPTKCIEGYFLHNFEKIE